MHVLLPEEPAAAFGMIVVRTARAAELVCAGVVNPIDLCLSHHYGGQPKEIVAMVVKRAAGRRAA